ncbi:PQQ-dependent sugar dehydrogenase [Bordetella sp. 2513F-2]
MSGSGSLMRGVAPRLLAFVLALAAPLAHGQLTPSTGQARATEVVGGLEHPWGLAFLPDGSMLITERPGRLRRLDAQGRLSEPLGGVPEVAAEGQGGLLDVALSPDFARDRLVYLSYAERERSSSGTAIGRGRLSDDASRLEDFQVLFRQEPKLSSGQHYGSRLVFHEGYLYATLGENNRRPTAQDLDKLQGKIVRLNPDGSVPRDNPFVGKAGARPEIWSYGHRNAQGMAVNPADGQLWEHEHGARGGDEVNIVRRGGNYGWPLATHGVNYSGLPIPEARGETLEGGEEPVYWWKRSPAVSGMAFYQADRHPQWRGSLFIGALASQQLIRLQLDGAKVVAEERLLGDLGARIRDVRQSPDGQLYILTDSGEGALLRVTPGS